MSESTLPPTPASISKPFRLIDIDSSWFHGVGRDMTEQEREYAISKGRLDNPPMSLLGITKDGLAGVDGKEIAQLFAASPTLLAALRNLEEGLSDEEVAQEWDAEYMLTHIIRPAIRAALVP